MCVCSTVITYVRVRVREREQKESRTARSTVPDDAENPSHSHHDYCNTRTHDDSALPWNRSSCSRQSHQCDGHITCATCVPYAIATRLLVLSGLAISRRARHAAGDDRGACVHGDGGGTALDRISLAMIWAQIARGGGKRRVKPAPGRALNYLRLRSGWSFLHALQPLLCVCAVDRSGTG
jgi:hypothetical protein